MRLLTVLWLGWVVVTYSGQMVAGPFALLSDCLAVADYMAQRDVYVSRICEQR